MRKREDKRIKSQHPQKIAHFLPALVVRITFYHWQKEKLLHLYFTPINVQGTCAIKSSFSVLDPTGRVAFASSLLRGSLRLRIEAQMSHHDKSKMKPQKTIFIKCEFPLSARYLPS